ncbi:glycosyltransferase family 2 protein [Virgibacillus indicus]|nr:glycosyltransferase [Virgibacillus indicus]
MAIKISIIVPVYNLEYLLLKCVDSILSQTFTNFELILVNDGSTDNSGEVCDEYAKLDSRVKVIHKENGGVASSRNAGLDAAKGKYIGFVDNDDYINEFMFETLYNNIIAHSSDMAVCDFQKVDEVQCVDTKNADSHYKIQHFNTKEALNQLYTPNYLTFVCPWNKLYKSDLFDEIRYENSINDDETVAHKLLYISKKVTYIYTTLYYYVQREESQTNSTFHINRLDAVYALKAREVFFREKGESELHQKALKHYMEKFFWYYYLAKSNLEDIDRELKDLKRTFDDSLIYLLKHKGIGWKQKLMCLLFRIHPVIFEFTRDANIKNRKNRQTGI